MRCPGRVGSEQFLSPGWRLAAIRRTIRAFVEVALALVAASLAGGVLAGVVLLVADRATAADLVEALNPSITYQRLPLTHPGPSSPAPDQILEEAKKRGLAETVYLETREDGIWIVFEVLSDRDGTHELVKGAGYTYPSGWQTGTALDFERVLDRLPEFQGVWALLLLVQLLVLGVVGWWRVRSQGSAWGAPQSTPRAVGAGLATGAVALGVSQLVILVQARVGLPVQEQAWVEPMMARSGPGLAVLVFAVVVAAPVAEEYFFRAYALRLLHREVGPVAGYAGSTLLFAGSHFNPSAFVVYVVFALLMAAVYRWTGRLVAPIVAHALINAASLATLL